MILGNLHPDDVLFFNEVRTAMYRVAKNYKLPLRSVEALAMPAKGLADRLGECSSTGDIRLVMRATENGQWCEAPRTPELVWATAAHELAHLRHFNHGVQHVEFMAELEEALKNQQEDHQEKVIRRLVKMQAQRDDAARRAEAGAEDAQNEAEAFAAAINRMLLEYELNPSDIDYARTADKDPVIELPVDLSRYRIEEVRNRVAWQESLARIVAKAHLCTFLLRPGSNQIWFVGTKSHATVAEYVYGILVPAAAKMSLAEAHVYRRRIREEHGSGTKIGAKFRQSWLDAFVSRIAERMDEARKQVITDIAKDMPGSESTAMIRLNGQMIKVQRYMDDRFKSKRRASGLYLRGSNNSDGANAGRAAANRMPIGRKGVTAGVGSKGLLA